MGNEPGDRECATALVEMRPKGFVDEICLPYLHRAQNPDGGWGFRAGGESRVEPTCWALMALLQSEPASERCRNGMKFLRAAQLPDGSWPATPEATTGCFVTSLACWVLSSQHDAVGELAAGVRWLNQDRPRDTALWRRWINRLSRSSQLASHSDQFTGWGWTPGTSSWVEPTAIALLAFERCPRNLLPVDFERRRQSAEALLYDRMCPGGGWNCGNPMVYGVAGEPLMIPTAWTLLALRHSPERKEAQLSLSWLEGNVDAARGPASSTPANERTFAGGPGSSTPANERTFAGGPGSLALARICLESYGRPWPASAPQPEELYREHGFLGSIPVTAWTCLAAGPERSWLGADARENR